MVNIIPKLEITCSNEKEFYLYYLTKHTNQWCKRLHLLGTLVGVAGAATSAVRLDAVSAAVSVLTGVVACWAGDYLCQQTVPTTFKYPIWSIGANFKMVTAMLKGDMSI